MESTPIGEYHKCLLRRQFEASMAFLNLQYTMQSVFAALESHTVSKCSHAGPFPPLTLHGIVLPMLLLYVSLKVLVVQQCRVKRHKTNQA